MSRDIEITECRSTTTKEWILLISKLVIHVLDDQECPLTKGQFLRESLSAGAAGFRVG